MNNEARCKNCGRSLEIRSTKQTAAQRKKPFYYSAYYYCPSCHKLYHDDKFKVVNQQTTLHFDKLNVSHFGSLEIDKSDYDVEIWTDGACVYNGTPRAKAAWAFVSGETEQAGLV